MTKKMLINPALTYEQVGRLGIGMGILVRVARFFLLQHTKTGENIPNYHKIYQTAIKYAIFNYKTLPNLPKSEFLV
jgi:hypothetical protein